MTQVGPRGLLVGARCFVSGELLARTCRSPEECSTTMRAERRKVWLRLAQLADAEDPTALAILEGLVTDGITGPDGLLGGPEDPEE